MCLGHYNNTTNAKESTKMYDNAKTAIITSFFTLKNKGLIASPKTEEEEIERS